MISLGHRRPLQDGIAAAINCEVTSGSASGATGFAISRRGLFIHQTGTLPVARRASRLRNGGYLVPADEDKREQKGKPPRRRNRRDLQLYARSSAAASVVGPPHLSWRAGLVQLDEKGFVLAGADVGVASPHATAPEIFPVGGCARVWSSVWPRQWVKVRS